jgi:hypothetical protein
MVFGVCEVGWDREEVQAHFGWLVAPGVPLREGTKSLKLERPECQPHLHTGSQVSENTACSSRRVRTGFHVFSLFLFQHGPEGTIPYVTTDYNFKLPGASEKIGVRIAKEAPVKKIHPKPKLSRKVK